MREHIFTRNTFLFKTMPSSFGEQCASKGKRDLVGRHKRPTREAKETYLTLEYLFKTMRNSFCGQRGEECVEQLLHVPRDL